MVDYEYRDLFRIGSLEKRLFIQYGKETLCNEDLDSDTLELTECLCEGEELRFGCCCASQFKVVALNYGADLSGQEISVRMELAGADEPFLLGKYTVYSDQESTDGQHRTIVAYDALCKILKANVADWYNNQSFPMTLRDFRDSFFLNFGITQEPIELTNDAMVLEKTIDPSEISGKDVLTSICEINGCFGRMNRQGNFQYVILHENMDGLYPSDNLHPADDLYPRDKNFVELDTGEYFARAYEKMISHRVTKLQIRQEEYDVGVTVGDGGNGYVIEDNFLVYGKGTEELTTIATNLLSIINRASYQPYTLEAIGDPSIEPGDCIRISAEDGSIIESYVLKRVLKGIQALNDTFSAAGKAYHGDNAGSLAKRIKQLRGKTNKIEHTIEMTRLEISDLEKGLSSRITQTAEAITAEIIRAQGQEEKLSAAIRIQAGQISSEVTRAQQAERGLSDNIGSLSTTLSSRITQTAEAITAEVTRAQGQEEELAAAISIQANQISLKVAKGEVSSQLSVESDKIHIESDRFSWKSTYSSLSSDGKLTARDVDLSGKITANSGEIAGLTIQKNSISYRKTSFSDGQRGLYIGTDGIAVGYGGTTGAAFRVSSEGDVEIGNAGGLTINSSDAINFTGGHSYIKFIMQNAIYFETNRTEMCSPLSVLGKTGGRIGFFGSTQGSIKQKVTKISSTGSATTSVIASKVNELIDALLNYGLITII